MPERRRARVLMVAQHSNMFRNLETVVRELDARGHETVVLHGDAAGAGRKMRFQGRGIEVAAASIPSLTTGPRPEPDAALPRRAMRLGRQVMNRGIYLRKSHPAPARVIGGIDKSLPAPVRRGLRMPAAQAVLSRPRALQAWRGLEAMSTPSPRVTALLREIEPDVVLVSPSVWPKYPVEADYIHAAKRLGIPAIGYLNSWDNLTSKGTIHVLPDAFIVWNEALAEEAVSIHQIPRSIIRVTGAPHLDHFFDMRPTASSAHERPYVVYLCSSRTLIEDETAVVTRVAEALAARLGEHAPTVVVRPHPVNPDPWRGYAQPGTVVDPRDGDQADTPESWQDYFNQLHHASAFVGLNTTAFLEAAVADRPCLTIVSDEFFAQQGHTGHFRHLLDAGFLEVADDVGGLAERVASVLDGADEKAAERRRFAERFLRPRGIETTARSVVADTIEELIPA